MKVERKNIISNLPKKGFEVDDTHHIYFNHYYNGAATGISTYVSHSKKINDYSGFLLTSIRTQLKLDSNKQVCDLVNCPMSGDEYIEVLVAKGVLPKE